MFNWGGNTNFHSMNLDWLIQFAHDAQETINNALAAIQAAIATIGSKQDQLVSGQNIKTINGESVLGSGNLEISGGSGDVSSVNGMTGDVVLDAYDLDYGDDTVGTVLNDIEDDVDELRQDVDSAETDIDSIQTDIGSIQTDIGSIQTALSGKQATLVSGQNIKTINGEPVLGSGNLNISGGSGGTMIYSQTDTITLSNHNTVVINDPVNVYIEFPDIDTDEEFEARVALPGNYSMSYDESVPVGFDLVWKDSQTPTWQEYTTYLITYRLLGVTSSNDLIIIMASYEEVSF